MILCLTHYTMTRFLFFGNKIVTRFNIHSTSHTKPVYIRILKAKRKPLTKDRWWGLLHQNLIFVCVYGNRNWFGMIVTQFWWLFKKIMDVVIDFQKIVTWFGKSWPNFVRWMQLFCVRTMNRGVIRINLDVVLPGSEHFQSSFWHIRLVTLECLV